MDSTVNSPVGRIVPILIFFAGLIGLYYLYQYLFGPKTGTVYSLLATQTDASTDPAKPIVISSEKLPLIYEGGEFSVSAWIYVNNWSYRSGKNKHILSIGGRNFDTIRVYLGGVKPKLSVRLHTKEAGAPTNGTQPTGGTASSTGPTESLDRATLAMTFDGLQTDSGLLDSTPMCDLPEIDLQRWVNIVVAVNGRTVDVYMDGKLSRSCVLPSFFKVDTQYSANLLAYGGFGGMLTSVNMYDTAVNPEFVYKNYIAGPAPITSISEWLSNMLLPGVSISVSSK